MLSKDASWQRKTRVVSNDKLAQKNKVFHPGHSVGTMEMIMRMERIRI